MMIDPKSYRENFENSTLKELFEEKNSLLKFMDDYENVNLSIEYYERVPGAETMYYMYIQYLFEIYDLIKIRMEKEDFSSKVAKIYEKRFLNKSLLEMEENERENALKNLKK